jgi:hypothetical protein
MIADGTEFKSDSPRGNDDVTTMALEMGVYQEQLIVLSRDNDPFNCGTERHKKQAEWFMDLWKAAGSPRPFHLRRLHYLIGSLVPLPRDLKGNPYQNTHNNWTNLQNASKYARHLGMIDPEYFRDHRNPDPQIYCDYPDRDTDPGWNVEVDAASIGTLPSIPAGLGTISLRIPAVTVSGYEYSQLDQPYHVELWIEKTTMNDVLEPLCERFHVNLVATAGFQSVTGAVNVLQRLAQIPEDKPARIFYVSDFDPAGDAMPIAVSRTLEFYLEEIAPNVDVKLEPLALTQEQVIQYHLPRAPIKRSDKRRRRFERRYGSGCVELDALEALHPGELKKIVEAALKPYRDEELANRLAADKESAQQTAQEAWENATRAQRQELAAIQAEAQRIVDPYRGLLTSLNIHLQAELFHTRERLNAVVHAIQTQSEELRIDLPVRSEASAVGLDEKDWLFDSSRSYLDQLEVYKKKRPNLKAKKKTVLPCAFCGKEFIQQRKGTTTCSNPCSKGLARQKDRQVLPAINCGWCGNSFVPKRIDSRFCKIYCRQQDRYARVKDSHSGGTEGNGA